MDQKLSRMKEYLEEQAAQCAQARAQLMADHRGDEANFQAIQGMYTAFFPQFLMWLWNKTPTIPRGWRAFSSKSWRRFPPTGWRPGRRQRPEGMKSLPIWSG